MEKIKILIKKLGIIHDSEIELSPILIFSGESGLGKSYLAILCHYFFDVLLDTNRLNQFIKKQEWSFSSIHENSNDSGIALSFSKEALEEWLAKDVIQYLKYMLNNESLEGDIQVILPSKIDSKITISYEKEMDGIENKEEIYIKLKALDLIYRIKEETIGDESPASFLIRQGLIYKLFNDISKIKETYIFPPSRGPVLTEEVIPKTGLYEKFKNGLRKFDRVPPHPEKVNKKLISLLSNILDGKVNQKEGKYIYAINNNKTEIPISAAAASIREIAPLAMLIERTDISKIAMLIEEPEAHLHPIKQRMMADIISLLCSDGAYMQITTHSDYFLRRINELIKLKQISEKYNQEEFENISKKLNIANELAFDYKRLAAYLLIKQEDGTSKIEKQNIEDGVPFKSFSEAISDSLRLEYEINEYLDQDECN